MTWLDEVEAKATAVLKRPTCGGEEDARGIVRTDVPALVAMLREACALLEEANFLDEDDEGILCSAPELHRRCDALLARVLRGPR